MARRLLKIRPKGIKIHFMLKTPKQGGRVTFAITKRIVKDGQKTSHETVKSERLDAINKAYKERIHDFGACLNHAREVIDSLYAEYEKTLPAVVHNQENLKLLQKYWDDEYADRDLVEPQSSHNRLARAVESVGMLSLMSASKEDLQKEVNSRYQGNRQRDMVAALNQLLRYLGREIKLRKGREEIHDIHYLNEKEFQAVLSRLEDETLKLLHIAAFATGVRIGEAFAIQPHDIHGNVLNVSTQVDRSNKTRKTKNRQSRKTYILKQWLPMVKKWAEVPKAEKDAIRNKSIAKITKKACQEILPNEPAKHCCFHDLRHSYAVNLVSKGVSLSLVAQSLGDSIIVAEKYYSGFVLMPESIAHISSVMEKSGA